ncbi:MAG: hypothetical protein WC138_10330, partial [Methanoculleus sp.]
YIVERMHDGPQAYYIKDSFVQEVAIREDALPLAPVACAVAASLLVVGYLFSRSVGSRRR